MRFLSIDKVFLSVTLALLLLPNISHSQVCDTCYIQCDTCGVDAGATFVADFRDNPDSTWLVSSVTRNGLCCGAPSNYECMRVKVYLHPDIDIIEFDAEGGAEPGTSNFRVYVNCVDIGTIRDTLCANGIDSLCLVYCKPGGNPNDFSITVTSQVEASPDIAVSQGCTSTIWATGLDSGSVYWYSISPGDSAAYNGYLGCEACDTTTVSPGTDPNPPDSVTYVVTGAMTNQCGNLPVTDTVTVFFYDSSGVEILPNPAFICNGGVSTTLEAVPYGGAPPYTYVWSPNGETTPTITVSSGGWYSVQVSDTSDCPPNYDSVEVIVLNSDISCEAGNDTTVCANSPIVYLNGSVQIATGGVWSTDGVGTFADTISLNTTYDATNDWLAGDTSIWIYLTTTGNGDCPPGYDSLLVTIIQTPTVEIQPYGPLTVCANNPAVVLTGTISNSIQGLWTTNNPGDPGTFSPNDTITNGNVIYFPSPSDTANGEVWIYFQTLGACGNVRDSIQIIYTPAPWVNAGNDTVLCNTAISIQLNGYSSTGFGVWSGGSGAAQFSDINDLNAIYSFTATDALNGFVELVLSSQNNGNCNPTNDTILITLLEAPTVVITGDSLACQGENIQLSAIITGGSGMGVWASAGSGSFSPFNTSLDVTYTPGATDIDSVTIIFTTFGDGTCPPASETFVVFFTPPPTVYPGNDTTVCENNANIVLNGSITYATSGIWSTNGTGSFSPSDTLLSGVSYIPSSEDLTAGSVVLTLTSTDGCDSISESLTVTFSPAPIVNAGNDTVLCYGEMSVQLNGAISGSFSDYYWSTINGTGSFTNINILNPVYNLSNSDTANGFVDLILTAELIGCLPVSDTVRVLIGDTTANVYINSGSITICSNEFVTLNDFGVSSETNTGIWLSSGDGYFSPTDTTTIPPVYYYLGNDDTLSGFVTLYFQSTYSCDYDYDSVNITINQGPWANAGPNDTICAGDSYVLNGISSAGATNTWLNYTGTISNANDLNATYTPSAAEILAGYVDLVLETSDISACPSDYDTVRISIISSPSVTATAPDSICRNAVIPLDGELVAGTANVYWTTNASIGYFSPSDSILDPNYYPGGIYSEDSLIFTLHTVPIGSCPSDSAQVVVFFKPTPTVNAGPDDSVCKNNLSIQLNGSYDFGDSVLWENNGFNGSFDDPTILAPIYSGSTLDTALTGVWITLTTFFSGCDPVIDSLFLTFTDPAYVYAGPDQYVCENNNSVGISGIVSGITNTGAWSTLGDGYFVPDSTSLSTNYVFGPSDTVSVTLLLQSTNNGDCNPVFDTLIVYLTNIPTVNAGPNDTVCANNPLASLNGIIDGSPGTGVWTIIQGAGTISPSDTSLIATYNPDTTFTLHTLVLQSTNACENNFDTLDIYVTPSPIVDAGNDFIVCHGESSIIVSGLISGGASTGQWTTNGSGTFNDEFSLTTTYNISYPADSIAGVIEIYLTSLDTGDCFAVTDTLLLSFGNQPNANFSFAPTPTCQGDTIFFTDASALNSSIDSIVSWYWDFGNGESDTIQNPFSIFDTAGTYNIVLTVTSARGCTDSHSLSLSISPSPTAYFGFTSPYCDNALITFRDSSITTSPLTLTSWNWDFGNGNTSSLEIPPDQPYSSPGWYTATLEVMNSAGCIDDTARNFYINASPSANFSASTVCINETSNFNDLSTPTDSIIGWEWDFGDGNTSLLQNPSNVFTSSDTFDVQLIATNIAGCSDTLTQSYYVWPEPVINIVNDTICPLDSIQFSSNLDSCSNCTFIWDFGDGTDTSMASQPYHVFNNYSGSDITYSVELVVINANGCDDTTTLDVIVHPNPYVNFIPTPPAACPNTLVQFQNISPDVDSLWWNFGDGSPIDSVTMHPNHIYSNDTNISIIFPVSLTIKDSYGCLNSRTINYTVYGLPLFNTSIEPDSICPLETFYVGASPKNYTYEWLMGDGTILNGDTLNYQFENLLLNQDTIFTLEVIATNSNNCKDTLYDSVVMHPFPFPDFTLSAEEACSPSWINFTNISITPPQIDSIYYGIDFNNDLIVDTTLPYPTDSFYFSNPNAVQETYNVILTAVSNRGCVQTKSVSITIFPELDVDFLITPADTGCSPLDIQFINQTNNANQWQWNIAGTINTNENPTHTFTNTSTANDSIFNVSLRANSDFGCIGYSDTLQVTVFRTPWANFQMDTSAACTPFEANFTNLSSGYDTLFWDFGDNSFLYNVENPNHIYENNSGDTIANLSAMLIVTNDKGCKDTSIAPVKIYPAVEANFTVSDSAGCSPLKIDFTSNLGDSLIYQWNFGDNSNITATNPQHTFFNYGYNDITYKTLLKVVSPNQCWDTTSKNIALFANSSANFFVTPTEGCAPFDVTLIDSTINADTINYTYLDTAFTTNTFYSGPLMFTSEETTPIIDSLTLITASENGCRDTNKVAIQIFPIVNADFTPTSFNGCSPVDLSFTNLSDSTDISQYSWDFGDGTSSTLRHPPHTFTNSSNEQDVTYTSTLVVQSIYGCTAEATGSYTIHATPQASFIADPSFLEYPNTTTSLLNQSLCNNCTWEWFIENSLIGTSANMENYDLGEEGVYDIMLVSTAQPAGCIDTATLTITVTVSAPIAAYDSLTNLYGCVPLSVSLIDESLGADSIVWEVKGGNSYINIDTLNKTFYNPAIHQIVLKAYNKYGDSDFITNILVHAYATPIADFELGSNVLDLPEDRLVCYNTSHEGVTFKWDFGDGNTSIEEHPVHEYDAEGNYDIFLEVWSEHGCYDSLLKENAVSAESKCKILMPSAFTPNPNGPSGGEYNPDLPNITNDIFHPVYNDIKDYKLEVFNRWGEVIFVSEEINIGWDGYYLEQPVEQDVYIWKITADCYSGHTISRMGSVTVLW